MMNENINMVELNDAALENAVGGVTVIENFKKEALEELIKKIPVIGPILDCMRKVVRF